MKVIGIIRLKGTVDVNYNVQHTMKLLRLHKPNHAVFYQDSDTLQGMLFKVKDFVTFGEVDANMIEHLLRKRGELAGKNRLTDKHVKTNTEYSTIKQLAKGLAKGDVKLTEIPELQPVFRLTPPRKGFKSLKYPVTKKGDLGYRGEAINELFARMA